MCQCWSVHYSSELKILCLVGVPRLFLPAVLYILDTLYGAIQTYETQPSSPTFPWLQTLNQIVKYLDTYYRGIFDRLCPRRRGTGGGQETEQTDTGENKKDKNSTHKSATKIKVNRLATHKDGG